jgi:tripartite-type tricarboxylate transporter receptor subunit TctC
MVAPGVPPERVKALQQAFDKTLRDSAFLKDAETMRLEIDSVTGDEIDRHVKKIFGLPKSLIERAEHTIKAATKSD